MRTFMTETLQASIFKQENARKNDENVQISVALLSEWLKVRSECCYILAREFGNNSEKIGAREGAQQQVRT